MRCIGRNSPCVVIENVSVTQLLSELPSIITVFVLLKTIVSLPTGTYFNGVWARFSINDNEIFNFLPYQGYHGETNFQFPLWQNVVCPLLTKFFYAI